MKLTRNATILASSFVAAYMGSTTASATTLTFITPANSSIVGTGSVNASGTFTTGIGTLSIDLSNLLTTLDMHNVGQNISDVYFSLENGAHVGSVADSSSTFINVKSDKSVASATVTPETPGDYMGWNLSYGVTSNPSPPPAEIGLPDMFHLDGLDLATFVPKHTIIGGTAGSTDPYSNVNNSIKGNGPHNPFAQGSAHWDLNIAGVTEDTRVTGVVFSFGTATGVDVTGQPVPEPTSIAVVLTGLLGLASRRKSR